MSGETLDAVLARQAATRGDRTAFAFVPERGDARPALSYAEIDRRARRLAAALLADAAPGDRAVLMFQPGLEFIVAFFACACAGIIAVPLMPPRRAGRDSSAEILADCAPTLALLGAGLAAARPDLRELLGRHARVIEVDATDAPAATPPQALPPRGPADVAFLQYTSGSTSTPKGVVVTHGNLLANMDMIARSMRLTDCSTSIGWVPVYHDMGLMMGVVLPATLGAQSVLMSPASFMQRPLNWLREISRYRAEVSSAPNFAYDLCADRFQEDAMRGVDLSSWRIAMIAAEPVQAATVARFAATFAPCGFAAAAMHPAYGLAEATLMVTSDAPDQPPVVTRGMVGSGRALPGQRVAIVDAESGAPCPAGTVGEIWASGANVARGYWNKPDATAAAFGARIAGREPEGAWLRTGDLGLLDESGMLFVTGRIKDLIIIRGVNHYPQDIERTVQAAHPSLRRDWGAAFAVPDDRGAERLVIVQEVERAQRHALDAEAVAARIRAAVAGAHDLAVHDIALIRPASLPKTTSGKVQRQLTRRLWESGALERVS